MARKDFHPPVSQHWYSPISEAEAGDLHPQCTEGSEIDEMMAIYTVTIRTRLPGKRRRSTRSSRHQPLPMRDIRLGYSTTSTSSTLYGSIEDHSSTPQPQ